MRERWQARNAPSISLPDKPVDSVVEREQKKNIVLQTDQAPMAPRVQTIVSEAAVDPAGGCYGLLRALVDRQVSSARARELAQSARRATATDHSPADGIALAGREAVRIGFDRCFLAAAMYLRGPGRVDN